MAVRINFTVLVSSTLQIYVEHIGQRSELLMSHDGPFHYRLLYCNVSTSTLLEIKSTGLFSIGTYFHCFHCVSPKIWVTGFAINGLSNY